MINTRDSLRFANVISKNYYILYKDMKNALEDFNQTLTQLNVHKKGPLFYSLKNVPSDEYLYIEVFMPIKEDYVETTEEVYFHSYYSVENMMSKIIWNDIEANIEVAYSALLEFIKFSHYTQTTPMYHMMLGNKDFPYVQIKVGYIAKDEEVKGEINERDK